MQISRIAILAGILFTLAHCSLVAHAGDDPALEKEIQKILAAKKVFGIEDEPSVSKGYRDLFRRIGPGAIRDLKNHKNHGVALCAAWQEVRLSVPEKETKRRVPLDPRVLDRFLGFVEGRLRVPIPMWWQRSLLDAVASRPGDILFDWPKEVAYQKNESGFGVKTGVTVEERGKALFLRVGQDSIALPEAVAEKTREINSCLSAAVDPKKTYVALHDWCALRYPLYCIDRASGKLDWTANVWAEQSRLYMGLHVHSVTVIARDGQVTVFGGSGNMLYVEAFGARDGMVLFRFCTAY